MILCVRNLSVRFGSLSVLENVSFELERGRTLALMGSNGAGKTTLIRALLGLVRFEGSAEIDGYDVAARGVDARRRIGYVPQAPAFHDMTAVEWLTFIARLRGAPKRQVRFVLERVGLDEAAERPVRVFSGGMQQRLSVAAALLGDPPLLILDEPTANLDPEGRSDLLALLRSFHREGRTLVMSSHRAGEVADLADEVLVLKFGAVAAHGPPSTVIGRDRLELRIVARDESEKRRFGGLLRVLDLEARPSVNGTVNAVLEAGRLISVLDSLKSDGVSADQIRLRSVEEGDPR